jgi:hypothetical protein
MAGLSEMIKNVNKDDRLQLLNKIKAPQTPLPTIKSF